MSLLTIKSVYGQTFYCTAEAFERGQKRGGYVKLVNRDGSEKVSRYAIKTIHFENIIAYQELEHDPKAT